MAPLSSCVVATPVSDCSEWMWFRRLWKLIFAWKKEVLASPAWSQETQDAWRLLARSIAASPTILCLSYLRRQNSAVDSRRISWVMSSLSTTSAARWSCTLASLNRERAQILRSKAARFSLVFNLAIGHLAAIGRCQARSSVFLKRVKRDQNASNLKVALLGGAVVSASTNGQ